MIVDYSTTQGITTSVDKYNKTGNRQRTYNVTLRRATATIVAVKKK
jgi:hypothetical protein